MFVLNILHFLLSDIPKNQKLAYKARFLLPIEIPLDLAGDEGINYLLLQLFFKDKLKS
jgi:hypothetical protein